MVDVHSSTSVSLRRRRVREVASQPLGAELNGRQRVLDLVRQAPRHLSPGRHLLRPHERRHVVEDDDEAIAPAGFPAQRRHHHRQVQLAPFRTRVIS